MARRTVDGVTVVPEAEKAIISRLFSDPSFAEYLYEHSGLTEIHFSDLRWREVFTAGKSIHAAGRRVLPASVRDALQGTEVMASYEVLEDLQYSERTPSRPLAELLVQQLHAASIRLHNVLEAAAIARASLTAEVALSEVLARVDRLSEYNQERNTVFSGEIRGFYPGGLDDLPGTDLLREEDWVIPFLLARRERMIVVGSGGSGKSFMLRMMAYCVENGVSSFTGFPLKIAPRKALLVEMESSIPNIRSSNLRIAWDVRGCLGVHSSDVLHPAIWHRPEGLDLRDPAQRGKFEEVLQRVQPDLVCIGPLKYLISVGAGERDDLVAVEIQKILNRLADKYGFAIVIEAHANKQDGNRPLGAASWEHWPDIGFALQYENPDDMGASAADYIRFFVTVFRARRNEETIFSATLDRNRKGDALPWMFTDGKAFDVAQKLQARGWA